MAQMAAVEEQWEVKKKKLQDELERVERMLADAYDRCVYMCVVCACSGQSDNYVTCECVCQFAECTNLRY